MKKGKYFENLLGLDGKERILMDDRVVYRHKIGCCVRKSN